MKKLWLVLLAVVLAFGLVIGCGGPCEVCGDKPCSCPGLTDDDYDITVIVVKQTDIPGDIQDVPTGERASGKGFIFGADFDMIKAAPPGSFLRVSLSGTDNLNWDTIGAVGINDMTGSEGNRCDFAPKAGGNYFNDVNVANIFALNGGATATIIHVNVWGGHTITKVELFEPKEEQFIAVLDITGIPSIINTASVTLTGNVNPADANNKTIVWSIKEGGNIASFAANVLTFSAEGKATVTATIANGTAVGTAFTKDFEIEYFDLPDLDAEYVGRGSPIGFAGLDGDLDWELFTDSTFIVFGFKGGPSNQTDGSVNLDGFGGLQIAVQHPLGLNDEGGMGWYQYGTPGWNGKGDVDLGADKIVYYVFPMNKLPAYDEAIKDTQAKIILNHGFNNYIGAWLTDKALTAPTGSHTMHGEGWFTLNPGL